MKVSTVRNVRKSGLNLTFLANFVVISIDFAGFTEYGVVFGWYIHCNVSLQAFCSFLHAFLPDRET